MNQSSRGARPELAVPVRQAFGSPAREGGASQSHAARSPASRTWVWPLLVWAVVYLPRTFLLGFVGDDWTNLLTIARMSRPWSWERWDYLSTFFLNRPVAGPLQFLFSSAFDASPALWALGGVVVALLVAAAVRVFFLELARLVTPEHPEAADLATVVWLLSPWSVGATVHPVMHAMMPAAALFALSGALLLRGWRRGVVSWLGPALLFALSCLLYEIFYGQFLVFLGIGLATGVHRRLGARALWRPGLAFLVVQLAAVWWNRFAPSLTPVGPSVSKTVDPGWIAGVAKNVALIPLALYQGTAEVFWLLALLGGLLLVLAARGLESVPRDVRARMLAVLALCAIGAVGAVGVFAMAGYRLYGNGHDSRTTIGLSFWLAAMLVPLVALASRAVGARDHRYRIRLGLVGLSLAVLAAANALRTAEWVRAGQLGRDTLAAVPVDDLRQASKGAVVLHVGPWQVAGIIPVAQKWAISPAVWYAHPELRHLEFYSARDLATRWDGVTFEQRTTFVPRMLRVRAWLGRATEADFAAYLTAVEPEVRVPATEVWIWDAAARRATRATAPLEHRPNRSGS